MISFRRCLIFKEYEAHFGIEYPLPIWQRRLSLLASLDYLHGEHDRDSEGLLPARLRSGKTVLNTGGTFLDATPGLSLRASRKLNVQMRFGIPVIQRWHGSRSRNVGQVAQDLCCSATISGGYGAADEQKSRLLLADPACAKPELMILLQKFRGRQVVSPVAGKIQADQAVDHVQ